MKNRCREQDYIENSCREQHYIENSYREQHYIENSCREQHYIDNRNHLVIDVSTLRTEKSHMTSSHQHVSLCACIVFAFIQQEETF